MTRWDEEVSEMATAMNGRVTTGVQILPLCIFLDAHAFLRQKHQQEAAVLLRRAHIPEKELILQPADYSAKARARIRHELLQKEIELLRIRLDIIRHEAKVVARTGVTWVNASARSQLGPYPWAKFVGIVLGSFLVTNALRKLPLGSVVATSMPLIQAAVERRRRPGG